MTLNRRNVLMGIGAAAAGSGAVFGSGAFTSVEADRTVAVTTAADNSSYVELNDNGRDAVTNASSGALQIDLSENLYTAGDGVNEEATVTVGLQNDGDYPSGAGDGAFNIAISDSIDSAELALEAKENDAAGLTLYINHVDTGTATSVEKVTVAHDDGSATTLTNAIGSTNGTDNEQVEVTVAVDTPTGTVDSDPQITLTVDNVQTTS